MKSALAPALVLLLALVLGHEAAADVPRFAPAAIELDRDTPPPGRAELGFDAGAPVEGVAVSVSLGLLDTPLLLRTTDGTSRPIDRRVTLGLGAAIGLGPAVVLDARMPVSRQTGDRLTALGDDRALDRWVPGDLRIGGRLRVVSTAHADALLRAELTLPTGDDRDFAGDPSWTVAWSLVARFRLPAGIVVAGSGGIRLRGEEVIVFDRLVGDELHGAIGVAVPIPPVRPLWCVPEQVRLTGELVGVLGDEVGGRSGPSPAEARVGVVTRPRDWLDVGVRIGTGLGDQIGSPSWRATVELTFRPILQTLPRATVQELE